LELEIGRKAAQTAAIEAGQMKVTGPLDYHTDDDNQLRKE
jgi:hypothetical protein